MGETSFSPRCVSAKFRTHCGSKTLSKAMREGLQTPSSPPLPSLLPSPPSLPSLPPLPPKNVNSRVVQQTGNWRYEYQSPDKETGY